MPFKSNTFRMDLLKRSEVNETIAQIFIKVTEGKNHLVTARPLEVDQGDLKLKLIY